MVRSWTLSQRIKALCAVVAVLLTAIAVGAVGTATQNRSEVTDLVDRVGPMRTDAAQLLGVLVDQETGVRGYALAHADNFLQPYQQGQQQQTQLLGDIRRLTSSTAVRRQADAVDRAMASWRTDIAEPTIAASRAGRSASQTPVLGEGAKARFDLVRGAVTTLQRTIDGIRTAATRNIQHSQTLLVALLVLAAIVIVVAGVALAMLMTRLVTKPVVDLAGQVRRVASGEYDLELASAGPPEVARLAGDVNAMRQQIVADLGTVRRARHELEDANRALERQTDELTRSNRDLEQFAYVASHDLQEPLRKVASFCQLLQRRYAGRLDERADQYIAFAVDGAQRMQRLINDLLAFSRIGRITSGFVDVDLDRLLTNVASQLGWRRDQADAQISWADLPVVRGEEPLLSAVFTNLLSNSLKFRHPDRPVKVRVEAQQVGDEWEFSVRDNGIGVEAEYADKIFIIFQRLHPKNEYPGTGIGLAITKKIIEYHGGRIWLDKDVRDGTLIRFTLPAVAMAAEPGAPNQPAAVAAGATAPAEPTAPELIPAAVDAVRAEENAS